MEICLGIAALIVSFAIVIVALALFIFVVNITHTPSEKEILEDFLQQVNSENHN